MDPMDLRLQERRRRRARSRPTARRFGVIGNVEVMEAMKDQPALPLRAARARTAAAASRMGFWGNGGSETSASASVNADGTVSLVLGSVDIGGTRASLAMQLAETLGITVRGRQARRSSTPTRSASPTSPAAAAPPSPAAGPSTSSAMEIREPAERARRQDLGVSSATRSATATTASSAAQRRDGKDRSLTFKQLAGAAARAPAAPSTSARTSTRTRRARPSPATSSTSRSTRTPARSRSCATPPSRTSARPSTPRYVEGQIQGGVAQGIGMALTEEYFYDDDGRMRERQLPRLPHADRARPADDRDDPRRGAEPRPPLRRPRRRRGARSCRRSPPSRTPSTTRPARGCASCPRRRA